MPERELELSGFWCSWCSKPILTIERRFTLGAMDFHTSCQKEYLHATTTPAVDAPPQGGRHAA